MSWNKFNFWAMSRLLGKPDLCVECKKPMYSSKNEENYILEKNKSSNKMVRLPVHKKCMKGVN